MKQIKTSYKIGITEAGDAGIDLSWTARVNSVDGLILITKQVTPEFITAAVSVAEKAIVHTTITGYGGTRLEPNVPKPDKQRKAILDLVNAGFPKNKIVIRVDPIIPTPKGTAVAREQIVRMAQYGFKRYRVSIIDMYWYVYNRFMESGLKSPYGSGFSPNDKQVARVDKMIKELRQEYTLRIESCAEIGLRSSIRSGCISRHDLKLLNFNHFEHPDFPDFPGYQRHGCMCYNGKTELLKSRTGCEHNCLYCYWKRPNELDEKN